MNTRELLPTQDIPDAWAEKGTCPACGAKPLKAVHLPDLPDYFSCPKCELSFELETSCKAIRIKNIPEKLEFVEEKLRYRWVEPAALRNYLNNRQALILEKVGVTAPASPLSDDEAWERMFSLYRLGNKPKMIQFMVIQAGATQEQAEAGFIKLKRWSEQEAERLNRKLQMVGGVTALIILVLIAGVAFTYNNLNARLAEKAANPSAASQPLAPLQLLNQLPEAVKPGFLKSPPVRVEKTGPAKAPCPSNTLDAAELFGGQADLWKKSSQPDSWQMMNPGDPATIRLPAGMYAGYIDNQTFVFSSTDGPATLYNVNFVAISCY
jgi:rubredoxin